MKRFLSILLTFALLLSLSACREEGSFADSIEEESFEEESNGVRLDQQEDDYTPSITLNDILKQEEEEYQKEQAANAIGSADPAVIEERKETPYDQLSETDKTRPDTGYGACRELKGKVGVILFFLNDQDSTWTQEETQAFTQNELQPALKFLEDEAAARKIELDLSIKIAYTGMFYDGTVITSVEETGKASVSVMKQMAQDLKFSSDKAMYQSLKDQYQCDEVLVIALFNKPGSSYAILNQRQKESNYEEHAIFFTKDFKSGKAPKTGLLAAPLAHEILRLYGAQVLYSSIPRKTLAKLHFNGDIMLSTHVNIITNEITDATAFYIGWLNTPPTILSNPDWNT